MPESNNFTEARTIVFMFPYNCIISEEVLCCVLGPESLSPCVKETISSKYLQGKFAPSVIPLTW